MSDPTRLEAASYRAAAPGTLVAFHNALKARMVEVAAAFWSLPTKASYPADQRAPEVIDGWLPPKTGADAEQFPFLIVRPRSGTDAAQGADQDARATVEIIIGTYSDIDDGWTDVQLLIDAIRLSLGGEPVLAGTAFEHIGPLTWDLPEAQTRPQWFGTVTTQWTLPRPRRAEARNPAQE
jgi:hypothetical protein